MAGLFKSLAADPTTFADAGGTRKVRSLFIVRVTEEFQGGPEPEAAGLVPPHDEKLETVCQECLALSQPHPSGGAYDAARRTMRLLLPRASADPAQHCPEKAGGAVAVSVEKPSTPADPMDGMGIWEDGMGILMILTSTRHVSVRASMECIRKVRSFSLLVLSNLIQHVQCSIEA